MHTQLQRLQRAAKSSQQSISPPLDGVAGEIDVGREVPADDVGARSGGVGGSVRQHFERGAR